MSPSAANPSNWKRLVYAGIAVAVLGAGGGAAKQWWHPQGQPASGSPGGATLLANEWVNTSAGVSPTRFSSPSAYDSTKAYGSLAGACAAASGGDTVVIKGGSYGYQNVRRADCNPTSDVTFKPAAGEVVTLGLLDLGVQNGASGPNHLVFDGTGGTLNASQVFIEGSTGGGGQPSFDQILNFARIGRLDTNGTTSGALIRARSPDHLTISGNTIGPGCCDSDAVGIEIANNGDPNPSNVTISNNTIRDVYDSCSETPPYLGSCTGTGFGDSTSNGYDHIDGVQTFGCSTCSITGNAVYLQGDHKQGLFIVGNGNNGTLSNVTIANNIVAATSDNTVSVGCNPIGNCSGYLKVEYNTIQGNFAIGNGTGNQTSFAAGSGPFTIVGNIIQAARTVGGQGSSSCTSWIYSDGSAVSGANVIFKNNLWGTSTSCDASDSAGSATFSQASWPGGNLSSSTGDPNLHLSGAQTAIDGGEATYCGPGKDVTVDIDRTVRPLGAACDRGADEAR